MLLKSILIGTNFASVWELTKDETRPNDYLSSNTQNIPEESWVAFQRSSVTMHSKAVSGIRNKSICCTLIGSSQRHNISTHSISVSSHVPMKYEKINVPFYIPHVTTFFFFKTELVLGGSRKDIRKMIFFFALLLTLNVLLLCIVIIKLHYMTISLKN